MLNCRPKNNFKPAFLSNIQPENFWIVKIYSRNVVVKVAELLKDENHEPNQELLFRISVDEAQSEKE